MITAGQQLNWWLIWVNSPKATRWQTSVKFSPLFSVTSEDFYTAFWSFFVFVEAEDRSSGRESLQPNPAHSFEISLSAVPPERANPGALPPFSPDLFYLLSFYGPEPLGLHPLPWHEESLWLFPLHSVGNDEFPSRSEPKKLTTDSRGLKCDSSLSKKKLNARGCFRTSARPLSPKSFSPSWCPSSESLSSLFCLRLLLFSCDFASPVGLSTHASLQISATSSPAALSPASM